MSPRLPSASTSSPASCAARVTASRAAQPSAPRRSKQASCGLTATTASPTASMTARQWSWTASAALAARSATGHSRIGSGSSPRTTWELRWATSSASRSAKCGPAGRWDISGLPSGLDGLLEARARGEARDAGRLDVDRLARARVDALARAAIGDVELAEARERDLGPAAQRLLDDLEGGVDGLAGLLLVEIRLVRDLVDEL